MARVPVHSIADAPEQSSAALEALAKRTHGRVLNIHGEMANAPAVVHAYNALRTVLADYGTFDDRTRNAIALAVSAVDGCEYCESAYTLSARRSGLTADQIMEARRGAVTFDPRLATLLAVVRQVASDTGYVEDSVWQEAIDAGWSDAQLIESFAYVIATIFTNYFNHMVGTELDMPAVPPVPVPKSLGRA